MTVATHFCSVDVKMDFFFLEKINKVTFEEMAF